MTTNEQRIELLQKHYPAVFHPGEVIKGTCTVFPKGELSKGLLGASVAQVLTTVIGVIVGGALGARLGVIWAPAVGGAIGGGIGGAIGAMIDALMAAIGEKKGPRGTYSQRFPVNGRGILAITSERVLAFGTAGPGGKAFMSEYKLAEIARLSVSRGVKVRKLTIRFGDGGVLVLDLPYRQGSLKGLATTFQEAKSAARTPAPNSAAPVRRPSVAAEEKEAAAGEPAKPKSHALLSVVVLVLVIGAGIGAWKAAGEVQHNGGLFSPSAAAQIPVLKVRRAPVIVPTGYNAIYAFARPSAYSTRQAILKNGQSVNILCTVHGPAESADGQSSTLWDSTNYGYIPDVELNTGTNQATMPPC